MYYKIWDIQRKKLVPRAFEETPHGMAIHTRDQEFAEKITDEIQEACRYFYEVDPPDFPGCPEIEGVSDEEIEERISRMDLGENCVAPGTRILTKDLRWVPVETLKVGDSIIGFEEHPHLRKGGTRRFQESWVTATGVDLREVYNLILSTGEILTCTGEHMWIVKGIYPGTKSRWARWSRTDLLQQHLNHPNRKNPIYLLRYLTPWQEDQSREAGYLAGVFDGEGSLGKTQIKLRDGSRTYYQRSELSFGQNSGVVLDTTKSLMDKLGFTYCELTPDKTNNVSLKLTGGRQEIWRFLGQIRPLRLLHKHMQSPWGESGFNKARYIPINRIEYGGLQEVVTLSSSSQTYLAEGFAAHNTREAVRVSKKQYPLRDLPYQRKRALIEHIERLKAEYKFQRIDEEEYLELMKSEPKPVQTSYWDDPVPAEELIAY